MAAIKEKTLWFCSSCGNESPKWMGRCPACGEWNTMVEKTVATGKTKKNSNFSEHSSRKPMTFEDIGSVKESRISLGMTEFDRLLGGGLVEGSLILIGGEPGIGKSTLSLQIPLSCKLKTLYVSGEESPKQVKMRADRLGGEKNNCLVYGETLIENVIAEAKEIKPELLIVDSVQTMYSQSVDSSVGSVSQIKEVTTILLQFAKNTGIPVILIGHITKDGYIAGPKILEHIVDVVIQFEGDDKGPYRILRSIKNRFGSTSELAVYEMTGTGLKEVTNPSEILMPMHERGLSGTAISVVLDGLRPFIFEVQALVSTAAYGTAQRSATGFDVRRLNMLLAVLEKRAGFKLNMKDVFLNMAGGIRISEPACDLAVVCAVLSSNFDYPISPDICFAGEVGLSGEIRPVNQVDRRIVEATRLGFKKIYVSKYVTLEHKPSEGIEVVKVADVPSLVRSIFK